MNDGLLGLRLRRDLLLHRSPARPEVRLDRRRHRGNLLLLRRSDEWRAVGLAVLFIRFQSFGEISGHVILRLRRGGVRFNDLAALRCMTAEMAELARCEPQDSWIGACFNFHHFDIQSTLGAAGCPEPSFFAFCLNFIHFDIQSRNQNIWLLSVRFVVTPAVYPRFVIIFFKKKKTHHFDIRSTAQKSHGVSSI